MPQGLGISKRPCGAFSRTLGSSLRAATRSSFASIATGASRKFPQPGTTPRARRADLDFSFSGLKTSLRYQLEKMTFDEVRGKMADLCASYQQAVVDALAR